MIAEAVTRETFDSLAAIQSIPFAVEVVSPFVLPLWLEACGGASVAAGRTSSRFAAGVNRSESRPDDSGQHRPPDRRRECLRSPGRHHGAAEAEFSSRPSVIIFATGV